MTFAPETIRRFFLALLVMIGGLGGLAMTSAAIAVVEPDEVMADPALEARARNLSKQLRCLVCQNQSIDDSNAELARDLRQIVRERLLAGDTDDEVIAFVTARYGDFVLLRPPVKPSTWGLWFGPLVILAIAVLALGLFLRRQLARRASGAAEPLSAEEQARLDELLAERKVVENS